MHMSDATRSKLQAWAGMGTWHTSHALDMERWYDFVDQYQRDHGNTFDEVALREQIEHTVEVSINEDLRKIIRDHLSIACHILDFLRRSGR